MAKPKGERPRKERPLLEPSLAHSDSKFARALGSVDYHTREAGLRAMTAWLARRGAVAEDDLLKLWKGIFYCFWHSDSAPVQSSLADRLSEITGQLPQEVGELYYRMFVRTMRREWFGIDRLRLDKFLLLLRRMFAQQLRLLQASGWDSERVASAAGYWQSEVLLPADTLGAAGVAYHLADVLLPELVAVCGEEGGAPLPAPAAAALLQPFCAALAATPDGALVNRLRQSLFEPLVQEVQQPSHSGPLRRLDLAALAASMFDLGAQQECRARNREALYSLSGALEKAGAQRQQASGGPPHASAPVGGEAAAGGEQAAAKQQQAQQQQQQKKKRRTSDERAGSGPTEHTAPLANGVASGAAAAAGGEPTPKKAMKGAAAAGSGIPKLTAVQAALLQQERLAQLEAEQLAERARGGSSDEEEGVLGLGMGSPIPPPARVAPPTKLQQRASAAKKKKARTPSAAALAAAPSPSPSPSKKSVRFSLRANLVNVIGQPPAPAEVRTPPTAKPKGPALKRDSAFGAPHSAPERLTTRAGQSRLAQVSSYLSAKKAQATAGGQQGPSSSAKKAKKGKQQRRHSLPTPTGVKRARATDFF